MQHAHTLLPTLSRYSWNLSSTSLDRFVQLFLIFSICSRWLGQVRWNVSWWGNRVLIRFRKFLVTIEIPSKELAKSSLHFLMGGNKLERVFLTFPVTNTCLRAGGWASRCTVPGVGVELLLQDVVLPAQGDGVLVERVSVFKGVVSLMPHILNNLGAVSVDEIYERFLLSIVAPQRV